MHHHLFLSIETVKIKPNSFMQNNQPTAEKQKNNFKTYFLNLPEST